MSLPVTPRPKLFRQPRPRSLYMPSSLPQAMSPISSIPRATTPLSPAHTRFASPSKLPATPPPPVRNRPQSMIVHHTHSPGNYAASFEPKSAPNPNNIKVIARFRPERYLAGTYPIVTFPDATTVCYDTPSHRDMFTFDAAFDATTSQSDVYQYSAKMTVQDVFQGYNGTILAYGQTGTGKSYTMMGDLDDPEHLGIIPRIATEIFDQIARGDAEVEYTVLVSYMEIYMENLRDLLVEGDSAKLAIHENKVDGVYVKGLQQVYVASTKDLYEVMRLGSKARVVASTGMNLESSRSHAIFQVKLTQRYTSDNRTVSGNLFLVDLAGSEKVGKTRATGMVLEEAKKINSSLSALGNVINALTDPKVKHVPYRDLKLTRILQESLGGNSRTSLIINCSPSSWNDIETLSTLRFGARAKRIKNHAHINAEVSPAELKKKVLALEEQNGRHLAYIADLERQLERGVGGEVPYMEVHAQVDDLQTTNSIQAMQVGELKEELAEKVERVRYLEQRNDALIDENLQLKQDLVQFIVGQNASPRSELEVQSQVCGLPAQTGLCANKVQHSTEIREMTKQAGDLKSGLENNRGDPKLGSENLKTVGNLRAREAQFKADLQAKSPKNDKKGTLNGSKGGGLIVHSEAVGLEIFLNTPIVEVPSPSKSNSIPNPPSNSTILSPADTRKVQHLEQALDKFCLKLEEMEAQNQRLRNDILVSQKISEIRNERIRTLERVLKEQQFHVSRESETFEQKLGMLRDRLDAVKQFSRPAVSASRPSSELFTALSLHDVPIGVEMNVAESPSAQQYGLSRSSSAKNSTKVGLNLRIVKPLRGGGAKE
ncbi:hypothetical protein BABINDRAFT_162773 [Babjeviella inositovora NRRL Y-12698]|uniref:Kinesin motor domain-containing protein n=1 Tax=Babjeviella inositovora NRRL Y-12698 TaxID=984486 RepID=A0A1E3QNK1_9ASCO|nr:uncharacterized protein BABINDRAFT_162773 [Babjeviella inositovora NRRL Y-12698]ODQ78567.1 hypothetical protein BABINDRAFT_162773 [Babjeviella inositovora NRRL Y-12698]